MNGILIIDKTAGMTSHDVVARCRRILRTKKIGHTGTLDPFATGVMVILVGKATRLAPFLDKDEKEYTAVMRFGYETDTGDLTGEMSEPPASAGGKRSTESGRAGEAESGGVGERESGSIAPSPHLPISPSPNLPLSPSPSPPDLRLAIAAFTGTLMQTPPMFSAKKIDGKKLYELARKGIEVERRAVEVTISELELIDDPALPESDARIRVVCSAGTYIRTLAEDIARHAGSRAHLVELRRTRAGRFGIERAVTLEALDGLISEGSVPIVGMNEALAHLPPVALREDRVERTRNGMSSRIFGITLDDGAIVRMLDPEGELIAVGIYDSAAQSVQPKLVLV